MGIQVKAQPLNDDGLLPRITETGKVMIVFVLSMVTMSSLVLMLKLFLIHVDSSESNIDIHIIILQHNMYL